MILRKQKEGKKPPSLPLSLSLSLFLPPLSLFLLIASITLFFQSLLFSYRSFKVLRTLQFDILHSHIATTMVSHIVTSWYVYMCAIVVAIVVV